MTPDTLFRKFGELTGAPDSIGIVRSVVLELAMQGRLVPQDERDAPATEQLTRIAEKRVADTSKVRRKAKPTSVPVTIDEPMPLPVGWANASLAELVTVLTRIIRKGSDFGSQDGVIVSRPKDRTLPLSSAGHVGRKIGRMARCERPAGQLRRGRSREAR